MKKVIYIEADEEITSVISRIKRTKEPKIALVVPKGSIILGSIVNLKMLKRHEKKHGKEISIITTDRTGRHLASQVGFEAMHSLDEKGIEAEKEELSSSAGPRIEFKRDTETQKVTGKEDAPEITFKEIKDDTMPEKALGESVKESQPKAGQSKAGKKRLSKLARGMLLGFGILGFIAGVLAVLFVLPKAVIYISPRAEELREEVGLEVKTGAKETSALSGEVVETTQELSKNYPATGKKNVGEKAKGTITVYNEWDSNAQPLVAGTRFLSSDGKTFKTTQAVNVPGTTVQAGKIVPGTANVNVEAQEPGEAYNIGSSNFTIPGLPQDKQAKIYGKSSQAMSGGFTKEVKVVSKKDIEDAQNNLSEELEKKAKEELTKKSQGKKILEAAFKEEVIEEMLSQKEGQEAEEFSLKQKKNFWTIGFDENEAKDRIISKIKETLPQNKEIVEDKLENVEYKVVDITKENGLSLSVSVTAYTTEKLELSKAKLDIPGKNKEEVVQYFKQKEEIMDVKVNFWPFWVKKVPLNRGRIEIKIEIGK